jgi:hypothetical protein
MSKTSKPTPVGQQAADVQPGNLAGSQYGTDGTTTVGDAGGSRPRGGTDIVPSSGVQLPRGGNGSAAPNV